MKLSHVLMLPLMFHVCKFYASSLQLFGCDTTGTYTVREINFTFICAGIARSKGVEWKLHFNKNATEMTIGMCNSLNCWSNLANINLQWKNDTVRELVVLQFDTSWNDSLLKCVEENNLTPAACTIILQISTDILSATIANEESDSSNYPNTPLLSTLYSTKLSETPQTTTSTRAADESNSSRFPSSPLVSTLHSTMKLSVVLSTATLSSTVIYSMRDSNFYQSSSEKTALSSTTDQQTVSSHLIMSSTATTEGLPSSLSRDLHWIIGCTVAAVVIFIIVIVFAIVCKKRKPLHIHGCDRHGRLWWDESRQLPVVCVNFSRPSNLVVTWDMTYVNGSVRQLGKCSGDLCETKDSDVVLTMINDTCELRLLRNHRQFAGSKIRCSGIFPSQQADCTLHVEYPAQLADCFLWSNGLEGGSVSGSCRVPKVYSSKNSYHCRWFQWINDTEYPRVFQEGNISLSEFTDCSGQQFFRGFCSIRSASLVLDGSVDYKVDFYPGSGYTAVDNIYVAPSVTPLIVDNSESHLTDCITSTVPFKRYDHGDEKGQDSAASLGGIAESVIGGIAGAIALILFVVLAVMIFKKRLRVLSYTKSESTFRSYISASSRRENALSDKPLNGGALDTKEISYKLEDIVMIENVTYDSIAMNRRLE